MCETAAVHICVCFLVDRREVDGQEVDAEGGLIAERRLMGEKEADGE